MRQLATAVPTLPPRRAHAAIALVCAWIAGATLSAQEIPAESTRLIAHRFLAFGAETRIVEEDGSTSWRFPESSRDGQMLASGRVLLALSKSARRPHGAVVEVEPDSSGTGGRIVLEIDGTQEEINTAQRLADGKTMFTEAGANPRIVTVDADGKVLATTPIRSQTDNAHMESRMTRRLPSGNHLVPQLLDKVVREYSPDGGIVAEFRTPDDPKDSWPFTAIRLPDGNTLVTCTHGNMVVEFDAGGAIVWKLTNTDFDRPLLNDPCGAQRLPNGNTVICSYAIGADRVKLLEVTRNKKLVWTFREPEGPGIHEVEILTVNGERVAAPALR